MQEAFNGRSTNSAPPGKFLTNPDLLALWKETGRDENIHAPPIFFMQTGPEKFMTPVDSRDVGLDIPCRISMHSDHVQLTWPPPNCTLTITDVMPNRQGLAGPANEACGERYTLRLMPRSRLFLKAGLAPRGFWAQDGSLDRLTMYNWMDEIRFLPESVSCAFNIVDLQRFTNYVNGNFSKSYFFLQLVATYSVPNRFPLANIYGGAMVLDIKTQERISADGTLFQFQGGAKGFATKKIEYPPSFSSIIFVIPSQAGYSCPTVVDVSSQRPFTVCSPNPVTFRLKEYMTMQWTDVATKRRKDRVKKLKGKCTCFSRSFASYTRTRQHGSELGCS